MFECSEISHGVTETLQEVRNNAVMVSGDAKNIRSNKRIKTNNNT
jgi:hypothetical protein